jgi:Asp-tRNA(Asn)/Glu-tRNA(Gln) amidotransferase A subunit family amidase
MSSLTTRTAREMLADLVAKRVSARELLEAHVARNDALTAKLNAVVATDLARARGMRWRSTMRAPKANRWARLPACR